MKSAIVTQLCVYMILLALCSSVATRGSQKPLVDLLNPSNPTKAVYSMHMKPEIYYSLKEQTGLHRPYVQGQSLEGVYRASPTRALVTTCSNWRCATCDTSGCLTCKLGFKKLSNKCVEICKGKGQNRADSGDDCFNCSEKSCETCHRYNAGQCKSCHDGFTLNGNHQCMAICKQGEYKTSNLIECLACPLGCSVCTALNTCSSCYPGYQLQNNTCCRSNQYGNNGTCTDCHIRCLTCNGTGQWDCLTCPPGYTKDGNGCKYGPNNCYRGEYWNGTSCETCLGGAIDCTSASSIQACLPGKYLFGPSNCQVKPSCVECTFAGVCSVCLFGFQPDGAGDCQPIIPPLGKYIKPASNTLEDCHPSCLTCTGTSYFCSSCETEYLLENGRCNLPNSLTCRLTERWDWTIRACVPCPGGIMCNGQGTSLTGCASYQYWGENDTCLNCSNNCLTCSLDSSNCTSCSSGSPIKGVCCLAQYYWTGATCSPCDASCATCSGPASNHCTSCFGSNAVTDGVCGSIGCTNNCQTCLNPADKCYSCLSGFIINLMGCIAGTPTCAAGEHLNGGSCALCSSNCATCITSASHCTSCSQGKFLNSTSCVSCDPNCATCVTLDDRCTSCHPNFYLDIVSNSCLACILPCANCTSASTCTSCPSGSVLSGNTCLPCTSPCLTCSGSTTTCTSCVSGKVLSGNTCLCTSPCLTCSGSTTTCTSCVSGKELSGSICLCTPPCLTCSGSTTTCTSCVSGKELSGTTCLCTPPCLTCSGSTTICTSCDPGLTLVSSTCSLCASGHYFSNISGQCQQCSSPCLNCSDEDYCTSCIQGYVLNSPTCSPSSCLTGHYFDVPLQTCFQCPSPCSTCSSATVCLTCIQEHSLSGNQCVPFSPTCLPTQVMIGNQCYSVYNGTYLGKFLKQTNELDIDLKQAFHQPSVPLSASSLRVDFYSAETNLPFQDVLLKSYQWKPTNNGFKIEAEVKGYFKGSCKITQVHQTVLFKNDLMAVPKSLIFEIKDIETSDSQLLGALAKHQGVMTDSTSAASSVVFMVVSPLSATTATVLEKVANQFENMLFYNGQRLLVPNKILSIMGSASLVVLFDNYFQVDESEINCTPATNYVAHDVSCNLLNNYGDSLLQLCLFILTSTIIMGLFKGLLKKLKVGSFGYKTLYFFYMNYGPTFVMMFVESSNLDSIGYSILNIIKVNSSSRQLRGFSVSIALLLFIVGLVVFGYLFVKEYLRKLKGLKAFWEKQAETDKAERGDASEALLSARNDQQHQRFKESLTYSFMRFILDDYRLDLKDIYYMTPLITIAKNFISQIIVISLADKGMVQVYLVLVVHIAYTVYYMKANPKEEKLNNIMSHITNVCFTIYTAFHAISNTFEFNELTRQNVLGMIMAIILLIIIGVNLIYILYTVISLLFKLIKGLCQKKDPLREKMLEDIQLMDFSQFSETEKKGKKDEETNSTSKADDSQQEPMNEDEEGIAAKVGKKKRKRNLLNIRFTSQNAQGERRGVAEANEAGASIKKTTIAQISFVHNNGRKANQINEEAEAPKKKFKLPTPQLDHREPSSDARKAKPIQPMKRIKFGQVEENYNNIVAPQKMKGEKAAPSRGRQAQGKSKEPEERLKKQNKMREKETEPDVRARKLIQWDGKGLNGKNLVLKRNRE